MNFSGFKTIIFILMHETIASKYYYKKMDGTYDVYYGPKAIWGYKEFKPPKSYKIKFEDRGDRPGTCIPGDFVCNEPFLVKETEVFECEVDYQCPNYFKCCPESCFQHKICQPASIEDDENNEIPIIIPTITPKSTIMSTEADSKLTTHLKTTSPLLEVSTEPYITTLGTESSITHIATEPSALFVSSEPTEPFTMSSSKPQTSTMRSEKSTTDEKSSISYSTLSTTIRSIKSTVKPDATTLETDSPSKPHSIIITTTQINKNTITDDEDLSFSGDNEDLSSSGDDEDLSFSGNDELDISTLAETVPSSTLRTKTTNVPTPTTSLKPDLEPVTTAEKTTKISTTLLPKSSLEKQKTTTQFPKTSTLTSTTSSESPVRESTSVTLETVPKSSKQHETTTKSFTLQQSTKLTIFTTKSTTKTTEQYKETTKNKLPSSTLSTQERTTRVIDITSDDDELTFSGDNEIITDDTTEQYTEATKNKLPSSTLSTQERTTRVIDITSDDDELPFSGDDEIITDDISTEFGKSSTVSKSTKILSSSAASSTKSSIFTAMATTASRDNENEFSNGKPIQTSTSDSAIVVTKQPITAIHSTTNANINKGNITDDEDLSFSGEGELDASTTHEVNLGTGTTSIFTATATTASRDNENEFSNGKPIKTSTSNSAIVVTKQPITAIHSTTNANINKGTITDDEDLSFSGDGELDGSTTHEVNLRTGTTRTPTTVNLLETDSSVTTEEAVKMSTSSNPLSPTLNPVAPAEQNINSNTDNIDTDDEDMAFSGDDEIESTRKTPRASISPNSLNHFTEFTDTHTFVPSDKLTAKDIQKSTHYGDIDQTHSTKIYETTTGKLVGTSSVMSTESGSESDKNGLPHTIKSQSPSTINTKLTPTTLPTRIAEQQTKKSSREQTGVTGDDNVFSTKTQIGDELHTDTIPKYTISNSASAHSSTSTKVMSTESPSSNFKTGKETVVGSTTNNIGDRPYGTGIIFANSLLGLLRKVPSVVISEASDGDSDPYLDSFLGLLGKVPKMIKEADTEAKFFNIDNKSSTKNETLTTKAI